MSSTETLRSRSSPTSRSLPTSSASSNIEISWGPAITASPLSVTDFGTATAAPIPTPTVEANPFAAPTTGVGKTNQIVVATTVIIGSIILLILGWAIHRRRKGAPYSEILHIRPRPPSTIVLSPSPTRSKFLGLPIMRESRYSVRSSRHTLNMPLPNDPRRKGSVPPDVLSRFHTQHAYIQDTWKTSARLGPYDAPSQTQAPPPPPPPCKEHTGRTNRQTFLLPASPAPSKRKLAKAAELPLHSPDSASHLIRNDSTRALESTPQVSVEATQPELLTSLPMTPPAAAVLDRFSWTNTQAPSTPRASVAPSSFSPRSGRTGRSSVPRFRTVVSWVRGQNERSRGGVEAGPRAGLGDSKTRGEVPGRPSMNELKNHAVKPILAPVGVIEGTTFGKSRGSTAKKGTWKPSPDRLAG
ncbi:hypothetical protein LTR95_012084 [Oleoguttula sp. CCFEE 5521]